MRYTVYPRLNVESKRGSIVYALAHARYIRRVGLRRLRDPWTRRGRGRCCTVWLYCVAVQYSVVL